MAQPPDNGPELLINAIRRFFGVILPNRVLHELERWLQVQTQNIQPNQQDPEHPYEQQATIFRNALIVELRRIAHDIPSGSSDGFQGALAMATNNLRASNPVEMYTALLEFLQVHVLREMANQGAEATRIFSQMTVQAQRDHAAQGLFAEFERFIERAISAVRQIIETDLRQWEMLRNESRNEEAPARILDAIQRRWVILWNAVWDVCDQLQTVVALVSVENRPNNLLLIVNQTQNLLEQLTVNGFIIERQPPRVMKTHSRYNVRVRHMMGGENHYFLEEFSYSIVSEAQTREIQRSGTVTHGQNSGDLVPRVEQMSRNGNRQLEVYIRDLQITRITRPDRVDPVPVTDQKFAFVFSHIFFIRGLKFKVWNISYPVVVIVHNIQEPQAWATIVWDNVFLDTNRLLFEVSDQAPWNVLGKMLNRRFLTFMNRPLTAQNLHCMGVKAARSDRYRYSNPDELIITRDQFYRVRLPNRTITYWTWLYEAMKIVRLHLMNIWNDGHMIGFIEKSHAETLLGRSSPGTFLIRFSDSQPGGITIAYVTNNHRIQYIAPFTAGNGRNLTEYLVEKIRQLPQLRLVYPGIPKRQAFGRFYPAVVPPSNGYVPLVPEYGRSEEEEEQNSDEDLELGG